MTARRWLLLVAAAAAVLLVVGRALAGAYAEYLWYQAVGAGMVWHARWTALATLRTSCALVATVFAFANLYAVRASIVSLVFPRRVGNIEIGEEVPGRRMIGAALALAVLVGITLGFAQSDWTSFVQAGGGVAFGETDPYVGADLGFFVYWLPFEAALWNWTFLMVVVVAAIVLLLYALTPSLRFERGSLYLSTYVRRHFTVLLGVLLLLLAWSFRLDMYALLSDGTGPDGVFGYVDHRVGLPANLILSLTTLAAGLLVLWAGFAGQLKLAGAAVLGAVALALLGRELAPAIASHWGSEADRTARERPYLATRAGYTRRAFAVDRIRLRDSSVAFASFSTAQRWVPVWDAPAITRNVGGAPVGSPTMWHAGRAGIVGEKLGTSAAVEGARPSWSVTRVLGWAADERGAPIRVNGAGAAAIDDSPVATPLVFPDASGYALVADSLDRVRGTLLSATLTRVAYAWSLQNLRLAFSDLPQPRPTILTVRDVSQRVRRVLPFFAQSRRVEPVVIGETIYWCVDLYSASSTYPLSRHAMLAGEARSYFQHAAVAIVQGTTGRLTVVPDSALDPVATTWVRRLPSLFSTWSTLPPELPGRVPPAVERVYGQAMAFGRFGTRAGTEVVTRLPVSDGADAALAGDELPYVLPDTHALALALPLIDESDRVRGVLVGVGGASHATVWYPLATPGARWTAILDRLRAANSAADSGATRDAPIGRGRVRAVPLQTGLEFVQPAYLLRRDGPPTLLHVAVLAGDSMRVLAPPTPALRLVEPSLPAGQDLRGSVAQLYRIMRDALSVGDWTAFGRAFDALGRISGARGSTRTSPRP